MSSPSPRMYPAASPRRVVSSGDLGVVAIALATAAARLPFIARPPSSDEGGFLLVASQWSPGRALYGNYWVDRPPLIIGFFDVADRLGGAVALRLLGIALAATSVLLAARVGHLMAARAGVDPAATTRARLFAAATTGIFLVTPLFGTSEVDGELIAVPLILLGITLVLESAARPTGRYPWLIAAGAVGAAAVLVKQSEIDVFVALLVALAVLPPGRQPAYVLRQLAVAAAGAVALTGVVLIWAETRGTGPIGLWDAVVTFRLDASAVIKTSASGATTERFQHVLLALLVSGGLLLPLQVLVSFRRAGHGLRSRLRWLAVAVVGWESFGVLAGGSYWLHYLVGLVPGLAMCAALVGSGSGRNLVGARIGLAYAAAVATVSTIVVLTGSAGLAAQDPVNVWLAEHARPGDTAVVAYGHPDILQTTGMSSPYPELWSLPVKVRDPQLLGLERVLGGTDRPTWVVATNGSVTDSLAAWGIDAIGAEAVLDRNYRVVADVDDHVIYLERSRSLDTPVTIHPLGRS